MTDIWNTDVKTRKLEAIKALIGTPWPDGCITWPRDFYSETRYEGKRWLLHRLAYTLCVGPISHGMNILHSCDNPPCFNPAHLRMGTQRENIQDCVRKGRFTQRPPIKRGESNGASKLTQSQVDEIRATYRPRMRGGAMGLGKRYGISDTMVLYIVHGRKWAA